MKLLSIAETVAHGGGFLFHGHVTQQSPGYPALLALLIRLHLARVWVLVGLNVIFLAIGIVAACSIFDSEFGAGPTAFYICLLSLLSLVFIMSSALLSTGRFHWRNATICIVLLLVSTYTRKVGLSLAPALVYTLFFQADFRSCLLRLSLRMRVIGTLAAALVGIAALESDRANTLSILGYFKQNILAESAADAVRGILGFRWKELGEIALNLPCGPFPPVVQHALPIVGATVLLLLVGGIASRRGRFGVIEVYFVSYLAILFVWPFYDPRSWLPAIPLLVAYCGLSLRRFLQKRVGRDILVGYLTMFAVAGLTMLASSTVISLSRSRLAEALPEHHDTYCAAWG